jgi:poly(3-hydroxybutyrate) depolymerase
VVLFRSGVRARWCFTAVVISSFLACEDTVAQLDISVEGHGTTTPSPGTHRYLAGTTVRVAAVPGSEETFLGWSGSASGRSTPLEVVVDGQKTLVARFSESGGGGGRPPVTGGGAGGGGGQGGGGGADSESESDGGGSDGGGGLPSVDAGGAEQSAGCGRPRTLQNGTIAITFSGASRKYILRAPDGYDSSHPYRLVFAFAESGSSAQSVADRNYFTMATRDSKNTIFAAPDAANGQGAWSKTDVGLTDTILAQLEGDLCIDKTRIFATGFSFGGGMSMALACTRADVFRAVAFFSGADLTGSCPATLTKPIAYYASQASQDANGLSTTNPMTGEMKQAQFAAVNGCTPEPSATTFPAAGQQHTCTIYKNCSAGHPTEYCVFNGPHGWEPKDPGQSTSWDAPEAWKFITQF